jgi:transcriptional regulator of acetoin/glycerol metabolism
MNSDSTSSRNSRTAQALGIERTNLHKKLRALGIHRGEGAQSGDHE